MLAVFLGQVPTPAVEDGAWTPAMITALFGGIVLLLGAVTQMLVALRAARKEAAAEAVSVAQEAARRAAKVVEVYDLVNDGNSRMLDEIKGLRQRVADLTHGDAQVLAQQEADQAQRNVDRKAEVTEQAAATRIAAEGEKD